MAELKPCPFCGCHAIVMRSNPLNDMEHTIKCEDCPGGAQFVSSTAEQAIAAWNRRATDGQRAGVPEGWKLMPQEPAYEMLCALSGQWHSNRHEVARRIYKELLAAAPTPPASDTAPDRLQELMRSRLTPFGLLTRALRVVCGASLMDMANDMGMTPAQLSALEHGRAELTLSVVQGASWFFRSRGIQMTKPALFAAMMSSNAPRPFGDPYAE
ncbi:Lar family restriction alleviation protein [Cupriavidus gilardii]|uniref:Lar family restriction alleviation protein n=1 Tax=Cupriavidus gilardii TaxID=82541 RepID=UPI0021C0E903|nr:Lar family restriction alleviation protein [Cupriavidus gilardii]MCT9017130.1 Lar family restriction alleviation protein [Cupriavidus gilardii]MCT9056800.1 Lar family restriction alleviation protein [Cupriavidus gilardii]